MTALAATGPLARRQSPQPRPYEFPGCSSYAWFGSYLQTYLERDVRQVTQVKDLGLFRRFLSLAAMVCRSAAGRPEAMTLALGVKAVSVELMLKS